jgi:adenylate cyclase
MDESRTLFEQAIALDAEYAPAWAGLATVPALLFEWWGARTEDLQYADRGSQRAMDLAPDMAEAHVARGCALVLYRRSEEAHTHFEAAARINPNLFDAYYYHARAAFSRGQLERSADLFRKASEVRREDCQSPVLLVLSLRMLGRAEEARAANREGIARAERHLDLNPLDGRVLAICSCALYEAGEEERAMDWSRRSLEVRPDDMSALLDAVCLRAKSGLKEEALELLEHVCNRGWGKRDWIDRDPDYDSLRDDPRFDVPLAKLKRLGRLESATGRGSTIGTVGADSFRFERTTGAPYRLSSDGDETRDVNDGTFFASSGFESGAPRGRVPCATPPARRIAVDAALSPSAKHRRAAPRVTRP